MKKIKRALISVSDKKNLNQIIKTLKKYKVEIISSGGTFKKIKKLKSKCKAYVCDITKYNQIKNIISKIPKIDILINNAGMNIDNLSLRMKDEEWKKVIDINLTSTFLLSKNAIKIMLKKKYGRIVNITSVVGHTGNVGQTNYYA